MIEHLPAKQFIYKFVEHWPDAQIEVDKAIIHLGYSPDDYNPYSVLEFLADWCAGLIVSDEEKTSQAILTWLSNEYEHANIEIRHLIDTHFVMQWMWNIKDVQLLKKGWEIMPKNLQALYLLTWDDPPYSIATIT